MPEPAAPRYGGIRAPLRPSANGSARPPPAPPARRRPSRIASIGRAPLAGIGALILLVIFIIQNAPAARASAVSQPRADRPRVIQHGDATTAHTSPRAAASAASSIPAGLPPARVSFDSALIRYGAVDGGWWPRSRNALTELPALIAALDARPGVRVQRLAIHRDEWDEIPHQLSNT